MKNFIITLVAVIALLLITQCCFSQSLNQSDRKYWNGFVDFLKIKGMKGSLRLDSNPEIGKSLFSEYSQINGRKIDYTAFVLAVQKDITAYKAKAWKQILAGQASFDGTEKDFMPGLSGIDGIAGSRTTTYKFPSDVVPVMNNGTVSAYKLNNTYAH